MLKRKKIVAFLVVLALAACLFGNSIGPGEVKAQDEGSIELEILNLPEGEVDPGSMLTLEIRITNTGDSSFDLNNCCLEYSLSGQITKLSGTLDAGGEIIVNTNYQVQGDWGDYHYEDIELRTGEASDDSYTSYARIEFRIKISGKGKPLDIIFLPESGVDQMVRGQKYPFSLTFQNLTNKPLEGVTYDVKLYYIHLAERFHMEIASGVIDGEIGTEGYYRDYEIGQIEPRGMVEKTGYIIPPQDADEYEGEHYIKVCVSFNSDNDEESSTVTLIKEVNLTAPSSAEKPVPSETNNGKESEVRVSGIKLSAASRQIAAGRKINISADVTPKNASNKTLTWASSNTKFATVDASGKVSFKKAGAGKSVTITAAAADGSGKSASMTFKIMKDAVKSIGLKAAKKVKAGKSVKIKATVKTTGKKVNKKLKWTSSNTKYATVNGSGKVKTYKAGKGRKVKITATATDGTNKKKSVTIKIK